MTLKKLASDSRNQYNRRLKLYEMYECWRFILIFISEVDKKNDFRNPPQCGGRRKPHGDQSPCGCRNKPYNTDLMKTLRRFHRPDVVGDLQFDFIDC